MLGGTEEYRENFSQASRVSELKFKSGTCTMKRKDNTHSTACLVTLLTGTLMMETEQVSETLMFKSTFTLLISREDFGAGDANF
jgi:hypothetical protein